MKKKNIVSLFLAGALLGGFAVTFTGCIDNDEPEGIKVLREAKAGLLSAKQAVAAAEATKLQAEATKALAEAELTKAQAEIDKILAEANAAKIKAEAEAAAAKTQAEADSIRAASEAAAAKAEAEIEEAKAKAQEALSNAELAIAQNEKAIVDAQLELKKALLEFDNGTKQWYLQAYYQRYLDAQDAYTEAYKSYIQDQVNYLSALGDVKISVYKAEKSLTDKINEKQLALDNMNKLIEATKAEIELAATLEPDQLYERKDSLGVRLAELDDLINNVALEKAQALYDNKEIYDKADELEAAYNEAKSTEVNIEPLTYTFPNFGLTGTFKGEYTILKADNGYLTFTVDENGNTDGSYDSALSLLQTNQSWLKEELLDNNDIAWVNAQIAENTNALDGLKETYENDKALWQEAVDFYNGGNGADITKLTLSGYNELKDSLAAYNALVPKANADIKAYNEAKKVADEADQKYQALNPDDIFAEIVATREAAKSAADVKRNEAKAAADNVYNVAEAKKEDAYRNAKNNEQVKLDLYNAAISTNAAEGTEASQKAEDDAKAEYEAAQEASQKALDERWNLDEESAARTKAYNLADAEYYKEVAAADEAYAKAVESGYVPMSDAQKAAYDTYVTAKAAADEARKVAYGYTDETGWFVAGSVNDLYIYFWGGLHSAINNLVANTTGEDVEEIIVNENLSYSYDSKDWGGKYNIDGEEYYNTWNDIYYQIVSNPYQTFTFTDVYPKEGEDGYAEFTIDDLLETNSPVELVKARSHQAFGYAYDVDSNSDAKYDLPYEQLIELTQEDIDNILSTYTDLKDYQYYEQYEHFGSFGKLLYAESRIKVLEALKDNPSIVEEVSAQFDAAILALIASKDAQQEVVAAAKEAWDAQQLVVEEFEQSFTDQENDLRGDKAAVYRIYHALLSVLGAEDVDSHLSAASIEGYQKKLEEDLASYEKEIPTLEDALTEAQKTLEGWQNGQIILSDAYKAIMEREAEVLAIKKEAVELAKAALDEAIAYLESL
jgi:hypothetical protein